MIDGGDNLRLAIVGESPEARPRPALMARRTRRRFVSPRRMLRLAGLGALGAAAVLWVAAGLVSGPGDEAPATLETVTAENAGSGVSRSRAPAAPVPPRLEGATPVPTAASDAPPLPRHAGGGRRTLSSDRLLALAAPLRTPAGEAVAGPPVRLDAGLWSGGACAGMSPPDPAAFCTRDGALYAPDRIAAETRALFALARGVGAQAVTQAGLLFDPAGTDLATLRLDCLAGLWAGGSEETLPLLNPQRLALALDPDALGGWPARRVAAFRAGYFADDVMACNRPGGG